MNLLLGPSMLDGKLFVSRLNDPFPDLYERLWDGFEWIWVNHGRPGGSRMRGAPGAAMGNEKLFVTTEDGALWERHWRPDLGQWAWQGHGAPGGLPIVHGPSAAMLDSKLFVVTDDGSLWELHWRPDLGRWAWEEHGRPDNKKIIAAPGAAMMNEKLFVVAEDGNLWERHWRPDLGRWAWENHGQPGRRLATAPGAAMMNSKLFVVDDGGDLWERWWNGAWNWVPHGRPGGRAIGHAPGAAMMDSKFFVVTRDGSLFERHWRSDLGRWVWQDHGHPSDSELAGAPGATMLSSKLFVAGRNDHLYERVWTGSEWVWVDHGTAFHDDAAHIIGGPGTDPKLNIAIVGDGFAEGDMEAYKTFVRDRVMRAFQFDPILNRLSALRVVRIDAVSPVSGVTERTYDEQGTPDDDDDDVLVSETFRFSRLGMASTGQFSHAWIEWGRPEGARIEHIVKRFAPATTNTIVVVNSGKEGGVNRGSVCAFTTHESAEVIAHELGHNLFALGDEYQGKGANSVVRREVNLTETPAAWTSLKWTALVAPGTPLPTDAGSPPPGWNRRTSVGAFEGGGARFNRGIFRPVLECRMNSNRPPWCPVCAREIDRILGAF